MVDTIKIWLETSFGQIPTSPKVYLIKAKSGLAIAESQAKTKNQEHGNKGRGSAPTYGATENTISLPLVMGNANLPLINALVYGKATTVESAASGDWAAETVVVAGDIVSHSDDAHSLICKVGGTTGSDEPDLTDKNDNDTIDDNGVIWVVYRNLWLHTGESVACPESFGIEITETDCAGTTKYRRALGCRINSCPAGQTGDASSYDMALEGFAQTVQDSDIPNVTYTPIADEDNYTEVDLRKEEFYNYEDSIFTINDVKSTKVTGYNATTTRNVKYENTLNQLKEDSVGTIDVNGTLDAYFDLGLFQMAYIHNTFKAELTWAKGNGSKCTYIHQNVKADRAAKTFDTETKTKISMSVDVFGTATEADVQYIAISPTPAL